MGMDVVRTIVTGLIAMTLFCSSASAQQPDSPQALKEQIDRLRADFEAMQKEYRDRLSALEAALGAAQTPAAPAAQAPAPTPATAAALATPGGQEALPGQSQPAPGASKVFNPDMAVIGNFVGAAGRNTVAPEPAMQVREAEASFQAIADPYARADFFMSFGESGVDLEEGYITFPAIPGGLLVKVGKMRAAFGKVNTFHSHIMTWVDRPLVTTNLLAGEDGINDAGFSVARLIPNRWIFLEATGQVYRGDSDAVFHSSKRGDLSYVGHLRAYHDLTENSNLDFGGSYAHGHNDSGVVNGIDEGRFVTDLYGFDATFRWRPLQRGLYRSFVGRSELAWSRRQQPDGLQSSFGYYVSGDYQLARRWFGGGRYDRSDRAEAQALQDQGLSFLVTYWPSEFGQVRGQYRRTTYAEGPTANELLFQFQYSIGAHGAHPF
ncbi:MAG TPA: hypothetical protein VKB50_04645 [Vicinamibacterales bacterium]|nr:hypothetical protein [Vicinamibacterales bacterium]